MLVSIKLREVYTGLVVVVVVSRLCVSNPLVLLLDTETDNKTRKDREYNPHNERCQNRRTENRQEDEIKSDSTLSPFAGLVPLWLFTLGRYVSGIDEINIPFGNIAYSLLGLLAAVGAGLFLKVKKPRWARIAITASKVNIMRSITGGSCHKYCFCRDKSFIASNTCLWRCLT